MYNSPVEKKPIAAASYSLDGISYLELVFSLGMLSFTSWNISSKFSEVMRNRMWLLYSSSNRSSASRVPHSSKFFPFLSQAFTYTSFLLSFCLTCCCNVFLNHFTWTPEAWIIWKNNFYQPGMNDLHDSVSAIKMWKPIVSHTSCIIQIL